MLKFEKKGIEIDQNVQIWVKGGNQWKHWNLKTKLGINQNAVIWMLIFKSIKMLKFEWKCGNWSKCWNLREKGRSIKCWYFIAKVGIDQNVGIWLKNKELIRILKFEDN